VTTTIHIKYVSDQNIQWLIIILNIFHKIIFISVTKSVTKTLHLETKKI